MNRCYKPFLAWTILLSMTAFLSQPAQAQWANGEAASFVIGESTFGPIYVADLYQPMAVTEDPATGKVFVVDNWDQRVLRFPSSAAYTSGADAEMAFGQSSLFSLDEPRPPTASSELAPTGAAVDAAGNLWVVDAANFRVLRYANAATATFGAAASTVLGQTDFVTYQNWENPPTASTFYYPSAIFCKGTTIWVGDEIGRVLRYDNAASKANGAPADAVFGQPDFVSGTPYTPQTGANLLSYAGQMYVDGSDNLWVADVLDNRVLMFPNASTAGNGESATFVLGQTDFTGNASGITASTMNDPYGIDMDAAGNLFVGDATNNRLLIFPNVAGLSNGAAATYVLGQPDFVSNGSGNSANQLSLPYGLFVPASGSYVMVTDYVNDRVVTFTPPVPLPLLLTSFTGRLLNNGQALLQWQVSEHGGPAGAMTELQYSATDTSDFTDILNTQPVNPAVSGYRYVQVSPAVGRNYYRVKLTMPDGSATYSQIVTLTVSSSSSSGLTIYPNPASSTIVMMLPPLGNAVIEVYNSVGGLMQRLSTASTINTLTVSGWAAGIYTVRVTQGGTSTTGNFIKVNE